MCNKYRSKKLTPVNRKFNKNNLKLIKGAVEERAVEEGGIREILMKEQGGKNFYRKERERRNF